MMSLDLREAYLRPLYLFYKVCKHGVSMKNAAPHLNIAIPTCSEQVKRLEDLLQQDLFIRYPRRLELTLIGEKLYRDLMPMFDHFDQLKETYRETQTKDLA